MLKLKLQYFGQPYAKSQHIGKDPNAGEDWGQEEKGQQRMTLLDVSLSNSGREWRTGSLVCRSPWGQKESDTTEQHKHKMYPWKILYKKKGCK